MQTLLLSADQPQTAAIAAELIQKGELVAIPTETVYGLGANGLDEGAVAKIFLAKGRPQDNPLILHICGAEQMELFCNHIPQSAYDLAQAFWPGPLTIVLPARDVVPRRTTGGLDTVAVRCPDNAVTREIIRLSGVPIAAPSANISGKPSTTTAEHVLHDHDGKIAAIVDGGPCRVGVESTIVDLTEERPRLLRPGGIGPEQLLEVLGDLVIDKAVTAQIDKDTVVKEVCAGHGRPEAVGEPDNETDENTDDSNTGGNTTTPDTPSGGGNTGSGGGSGTGGDSGEGGDTTGGGGSGTGGDSGGGSSGGGSSGGGGSGDTTTPPAP